MKRNKVGEKGCRDAGERGKWEAGRGRKEETRGNGLITDMRKTLQGASDFFGTYYTRFLDPSSNSI